MLVMKFGGTSVGTAENLRTACQLVKGRLDRKPFVVVSAHNSPKYRMTDTLVASAQDALAGNPDISKIKELQHGICDDLSVDKTIVDPLLDELERLLIGISMIGELSPRTNDVVMSFGERMSHLVFADVARREFGIDMKNAASYELGLRTDSNFGFAQPDKTSYPEVAKNAHALGGEAIVTTGFLGKSPDGHITTLGRGGSDFSATIFGAALSAEEVEIWTDVDGVMSADPKLVPKACSIAEMSFMEASELAWYGAKVLHPSTMLPAMEHNIPVRVLNTAKPDHPGTVIVNTLTDAKAVAKSVVYKKHIHLVTITSSRMLGTHGFMAKVFEVFNRHNIDIHMIATSEVTISVTVPGEQEDKVSQAAEELKAFSQVEVEHNKALVCVVGEGMAGVRGTASRVCQSLAKAEVNIRMISQGARELNIALLVDEKRAQDAVKALHDEFFD